MVLYNKGDFIPIGTRVRVARHTAPYSGVEGTVVTAPAGKGYYAQLRTKTRITWVQLPTRNTPFGFYTDNLERIEDMQYGKNLVGPKPEPVKEPEFITPLRADGANVVDDNGKVVTRVQFGGYVQGSYRSELPVATKYALAEIFAQAVNEKYGKVEDSKSPF